MFVEATGSQPGSIRALFCHSRGAAHGSAGLSRLEGPRQLGEMMILAACGAVGEIAAQREFAARKRQLVPGNVGLVVQPDLQALRSRRKLGCGERGTETHVN